MTLPVRFLLGLAGLAGPCGPPVFAGTHPLLEDLPPGVFVQRFQEADRPAVERIGQRLGGGLNRLVNSWVTFHGARLQVNVMDTTDAEAAQEVYDRLLEMRQNPLVCRRKGLWVVEFAGKTVDPNLARKAAWELGLQPKPNFLQVRVKTSLATVNRADYMQCNPLFNRLLQWQRGDHSAAVTQAIRDLQGRFEFGRSLNLRLPGPASFSPPPLDRRETPDPSIVRFTFGDDLPRLLEIPFVEAEFTVTARAGGYSPAPGPDRPAWTAATPHWPAEDPGIRALAQRITRGAGGREQKVKALLEWLQPGKNIRSYGPTGSRWGTQRVLRQGFGHCWDFSDCFITLARALDIPTRQVAGWLYGSSGHVWAEVRVADRGWQQVDATGGGQLPCGIYHLPWFTSEDGDMPILYVEMPQLEISEEPTP